MKKAVLIFLLFVLWITFQFQGCGDEIYNIITYDTTAVVETSMVFTVFIDTSYIEKESDNSLVPRYWVYCYSNIDSTVFHIKTGSIYDYNDSVLDRRELDAVMYENYMLSFGYRINGNYNHINLNDSLLIEIDYRIIKLLGVSDTGFVYEVLRDSTTSRRAPVIPG